MTSRELDDADTRPGAPNPPPDPLIGQRLRDRYEVVRVLGKGGMATAYLARDLEISGLMVVLKVPRDDLAREIGRDIQLLDRFEREIDALARLQHQNTVRIRGRGRLTKGDLELPFVVVDFKGGGDLTSRLRNRTESIEAVLEWIAPIADALDFVHDSGWIHRDIKPDNVLFDSQGFVCLSDFGIAKKVIETGVETSDTPFSTTQRSVIGTPGYIPPEAYEGGAITRAYDQYSLAMVVFQALSGERPPQQLDEATTRSILAKLPRALRPPIARALSRRPGDRFDTCREFVIALRDASRPAPWKPVAAAVGAATVLVGAAYLLLPIVLDGQGSTLIAPTPTPTESPQITGDSEPRIYELGSTAAEAEEAVALCRDFQVGGDPTVECAPSLYADEAPTRSVTLAPFELDPHEVTAAEFRDYVQAQGKPPTQAEHLGRSFVPGQPFPVQGLSWRSPGWKDPREDEPVVHLTRAEASDYCDSLGKRLPSADEWEAIARGPQRHRFPWGEPWNDKRARWLESDALNRPAPVGQYEAAPDGYYDLAGNVWEWTATDEKDQAVVKGGSWAESNPANLRGAAEMVLDSTQSYGDVGFRCARSAERWPDAEK